MVMDISIGTEHGRHAVYHGERLMLRIDGCAGIAFLVGIVPVGTVSGELQIQLACLHLCLLKTEKVCVERKERFLEIFPYAGTQTVYIP